VALERWKVGRVMGRHVRSWAGLNCNLGGLLEVIMGRYQTEFGEVGAKAVGEVAVEKKTANWGDGRHVHTGSRHLPFADTFIRLLILRLQNLSSCLTL
jgi:hypothetical protein